jgi:hypothetical protein
MEKQNIYNWITRIIETCNNDFHFESVDKLVELFYEKFLDGELRTDLQIKRQYKWDEIHSILK